MLRSDWCMARTAACPASSLVRVGEGLRAPWSSSTRDTVVAPKLGVIGSADTTTAIVTVSTAFPFWSWLRPLLLAAAALAALVLSIRVRRLEKRLRDREPES